LLVRVQKTDNYDLVLPTALQDDIAMLSVALAKEHNISQAIHRVLTGVWMTKWTRTSTNLFPCPTERLLALTTLDKDGKHQQPHNVTGLLAQLEYCIRLTCLKELKLRSSNIFDNDDEASCDSLLPWFTEKTNSPFARIRSLQHHASSIAFTMMGMPRIWWTDQICWKELLYNGDKIHIDQLHNMFAASEETIINLWEQKILKGISIHVDYQDLADSLGNHDLGYSFLTDPHNSCFQNRDALAHTFMADSKTKTMFGDLRDGNMV